MFFFLLCVRSKCLPPLPPSPCSAKDEEAASAINTDPATATVRRTKKRSYLQKIHPRQRLCRSGSEALSDEELIALLLHRGKPGLTVQDLAREVTGEIAGLTGLTQLDASLVRRLGKANAASLIAAVELSRRLARARMFRCGDLLDRPDAVATYLTLRYGWRDQEVMGALYLDVRNRLLAEREVFRGTLTRAAVEPRAILKEALLQSASGFVLFHTHPSGDPAPSEEDLSFTRRMAEAADFLEIQLLDHLILGGGRWVSLGRSGVW